MDFTKIVGFEIVEFSDISDDYYTPGIIQDYWCIDKSKLNFKQKYLVYPANRIAEKYGIKSNERLETVVRKHGHLVVKLQLDCNKCTSEIKIKTRKELKYFLRPGRWAKRPSLICKRCRSKGIEYDLMLKLENIKNNIKETEINSYSVNQQNLSYLEKIFLLSLISYEGIENQGTSLNSWANFSEHEACGAEVVIESLIDKRFINIDDNLSKIKSSAQAAQQRLNEFRDILDTKFIVKYETILSDLGLPKTEVNIPDDYSSPSEFSLSLLEDIKTAKLSSYDIEQITDYVTNKRINEIDNLYFYICNKKRIPSTRTAKKILVFKKIAENFNLLETMNILSYQGRLMQGVLYDGLKSNNTIHNANIFIRRIEIWVDRMIDSTEPSRHFIKKLPENWETTQTEVIISLEILELLDTWEKFTTKQILHTWFNKVATE